MSKIGLKQVVDVITGFVGWFFIHSLYWEIVRGTEAFQDPEGLMLFCCSLPLMPTNFFVLFALGHKRRWLVTGALVAIVVNAIGLIFTASFASFIFDFLAMLPFFMSQ